MERNLWKKEFVIGIIILFFGASFTTNISGDFNIEEKIFSQINPSSFDNDWWPTFQHDYQHSGYTTSEGPTTNEVLWTRTLNNNPYINSPVIYKDRVYIGARSSA